MKIFLIVLMIAGAFLIPGSFFDAYGLSCAPPKIAEAVKETELVFSGKVISVENTLNYNEQLVPTKTLFSVTEHFKGAYEKKVTVFSDETWGPFFQEGKEYLVFADTSNDSIKAQLCSPIDLVENSDMGLVRELSINYAASPLQQIHMGVLPEEIICRNNYELIFKSTDKTPACAKPATIEKLIQRGWGFVAKDSTLPEPNMDGTVDFSKIVNANNKFALDFYSIVAKENENIFYSPWSISTAFAMAYEGATGENANEMSRVFGFSADNEQRRNGFQSANNQLNQENAKYSLSVANALWVADFFEPKQDYVQVSKTYYDSKVSKVDFVSNEGVKTINKWVGQQTQDKIKKILEEGSTDALTRLVITNAIYFKGNWVTQFDEAKTQEDNFWIGPVSVKVPMMRLEPTEFNFANNSDLKILELPYEGDKLSMLVLLPHQNDSLGILEESLTYDRLKQLKSTMSPTKIEVMLPKFTMETNYDLIPSLKSMGLKEAFSPSDGFSGITELERLFIEKALHKAFVDVNEEGTEAAAVTAVEIRAESASEHEIFRADHPFVFIIQDNETGNILFIGKLANPSE